MIKTVAATVLCSFLPCVVSHAELAKPVRILEHDIPHAAPFLADLDGDGKQELLVGHFRGDPYAEAQVEVYRNSGTKKAPKYGEGAWIEAGGAKAGVTEFCHTGFGPQVIDFDGDGIRDLIAGSHECELRVFAGRADGSFNAATSMKYVSGNTAEKTFRYNSRLFAHDWDSDGDLDLLSARYKAVWLIPNEGDARVAKFGTPVELLTRAPGADSLTVCAVADWNKDGRDDLLVGKSDGSIDWYRNNAEPKAVPILGEPKTLVSPGASNNVRVDPEGNFEGPDRPTSHIRFCVADYNGDGHLDLLVGDSWRKSRVFDKEHPRPEKAEDQKKAEVKERKLRSELRALEKTPANETAEQRRLRKTAIIVKKEECGAAWREVYRGPDARSTRHGSVWYFERLVP